MPELFSSALADSSSVAVDGGRAVNSAILEQITTLSLQSVYLASALIAVLVIIALLVKNQSELVKNLLFWPMVIAIGLTTVIMGGSTIYLNVVSHSKGPVHWHADVEIWACGQELNLKDPQGFSNKIGSPVLHEHNDKRIHLEGVVVNLEDASLGHFFETIGGKLTSDELSLPTNDGQARFANGELCGEHAGEVQVFQFLIKDGKITQRKLADPAGHIYGPHSQVPPGDCLIVEFDRRKDQTDKLCRSYVVERQKGDAQ